MASTILIVGASGRVGSRLVQELDKNSHGVGIRLTTSNAQTAAKWRAQGRDSVVMDLNDPATFAPALAGVERVFLLTGYTAAMLTQSKTLVDAAQQAGVKHMVHLGVFTSRRDAIPHFIWHDLIESYIEASGMAWTHLHPNVIAESVLVTDPPLTKTKAFSVNWRDKPQGFVFAEDIAAVAAAVLTEGPEKHAGKDYWMSTEVLTGPQIAAILTQAAGTEIQCIAHGPDTLEAYVATIPTVPERAYMESAVVTMQLAATGQMQRQVVVRDGVLTVLGRPGTTMKQWAQAYFSPDSAP